MVLPQSSPVTRQCTFGIARKNENFEEDTLGVLRVSGYYTQLLGRGDSTAWDTGEPGTPGICMWPPPSSVGYQQKLGGGGVCEARLERLGVRCGSRRGRNLGQVLCGTSQSQQVVEMHTLSQRGSELDTHINMRRVQCTRCRHTKLMTHTSCTAKIA